MHFLKPQISKSKSGTWAILIITLGLQRLACSRVFILILFWNVLFQCSGLKWMLHKSTYQINLCHLLYFIAVGFPTTVFQSVVLVYNRNYHGLSSYCCLWSKIRAHLMSFIVFYECVCQWLTVYCVGPQCVCVSVSFNLHPSILQTCPLLGLGSCWSRSQHFDSPNLRFLCLFVTSWLRFQNRESAHERGVRNSGSCPLWVTLWPLRLDN